MRKQIDWYAEQLGERGQAIEELTVRMSVLADNNSWLETRIKALEEHLSKPGPEQDECVRCVLC